MADLNLTPLLRKQFASYPRKLGRYHSSEMFGIAKGYVTPEKWLHRTPFALAQIMAMWNGMLVHEYVEKLLPIEGNEVKKIHTHNISPTEIIQLVAKADHLPTDKLDEVWEFKTSKNPYVKAKEEHLYQVKLYCTVHERDIGRVFQPVQNKNGLFLQDIGEVKRDDVWFQEQIDILAEFHKKVAEAYQYSGATLEDINNPLL